MALLGLVLSGLTPVGPYAERLVVPVLMGLLTVVFVQVSPRRLRDAFVQVRVLVASLGINFVWTPALAWTLGVLLLGSELDMRVGLLLLLVTPCTDWYLVFTSLARGNVALATALLPVNLLLQLVLLPVYVMLLAGALVPVDPTLLGRSVLQMLVVPILAAAVIRSLVRASGRIGWLEEELTPRLTMATAVLLAVAVGAVFAAHGEVVLGRPRPVLLVVPAIGAFFAINFLVSQRVSRIMQLPDGDATTLTMTTLARNSPLALGIAVTAFPDRPLVAVALVAGPLIELPVLLLTAQTLRRKRPG